MKGAAFIFALFSVLALAQGTASGLLEADSDAELKASVRRRLQTRNLI
jgi:hypothetical protein